MTIPIYDLSLPFTNKFYYIMRNFKWIRTLLPVLLTLVITGCDDDKEEDLPPTSTADLTILTPMIDVEAEGGLYSALYKLEGAASDARCEATCDEPWVNGFDMSIAGEISFNVEANEQQATRQAIVTVTCSGVSDEFTVSQHGSEPTPGFTIEIKEIYDAGVLYRIVPEDPLMTYISMVAEKSYIDSYESDAAYFNDELSFFKSSAEAAGIELSEYLAKLLKQGEVSGPAYRLKPENDYYAYAYGMSADGQRLTPIYKTEFTTVAVERSNVELDISYVISGSKVTMTVTPSDPEQYYIFNVMAAQTVTGDNVLLEAAQSEIDQYIQYYEYLFGVPQDEAVKRFASKGTNSYTFDGLLEQDTEYVGYAVALTRLGSICSDVVSKKFRTESDTQDENPIAITLANLTDQEVTVTTTTAITDHYVIGVDYAANWDGMNDEEILNRLVAGYQWQAKGGTGNGTFTFYSLTPQTRYSIFAFGYVNGVATTKLCRFDFTTNDAAHADITFRMEYDKYFDGTELAETVDASKFADARGKAVLPVRLITEGADACSEIYYGFYEGDYSDTEKWPDDTFMEELLDIGYWQSTNCFFLEYDKPYTMIGFGVTDNFAIGPMSRQVVRLSRDGVSPASEFDTAKSAKYIRAKRNRKHAPTMSLKPGTTGSAVTFLPDMPGSFRPVTAGQQVKVNNAGNRSFMR